MKFRIRCGSISTLLVLPDIGECTFEALESAVGRHCGLARGTYALSLNGLEPLQLSERDSLNDAGIRSGDLIVIMETNDSREPVFCAGGSSSPAAGGSAGVSRAAAIAGDWACGPLRQSEGASAASPSGSAPPAPATSTDGHVAPACCTPNVSSELPLPPKAVVVVPADRAVIARPVCDQLIAAKPSAVSRADDSHGDFNEAKLNRCLKEPLLVSEVTMKQFPRSLTTALQSVYAVNGWNESDVLFAVLHVLMIESGYQASELLSPQLQQPEAQASTCLVFCGTLPPAWKTSFGYSVRYVHPLLGDAAAFSFVGVSMGPSTLIVRAMAGNKCLAIMELHVKDYVNSLVTGLNPLKIYKLARLSCLFKDAFAHRLLSILEEFLSPPEESDSVEKECTPCRVVCYRRWSPDLLRLPAELLFYFLGFLDPQGLNALGATCRLLRDACRQPLLWRRHYVARFGLPRVPSLVGFKWFEEYLRLRKEHLLVLSFSALGKQVIDSLMPNPAVPLHPWLPQPLFYEPPQLNRLFWQRRRIYRPF